MSESGGFWGSDSADVGLNEEGEMRDKFIKYCVEVMGYTNHVAFAEHHQEGASSQYNPYDDLNQMAVVVEKLMLTERFLHLKWGLSIYRSGVKQAFRDFIFSTMPE